MRVTTAVEADDAIVAIADSGVGVPADELHRLFERFYRASTSRGSAGTGLGLSVVKAVVEADGGTIEATSEAGRGTTFTLRLPRIA